MPLLPLYKHVVAPATRPQNGFKIKSPGNGFTKRILLLISGLSFCVFAFINLSLFVSPFPFFPCIPVTKFH